MILVAAVFRSELLNTARRNRKQGVYDKSKKVVVGFSLRISVRDYHHGLDPFRSPTTRWIGHHGDCQWEQHGTTLPPG